MSGVRRSSRPFTAIYVGWIVVCAILFVALRDVEDPSRREDRILKIRAGDIGLAALKKSDRARFNDYRVVHVALAGDPDRWLVLADRVPYTALREAVVVEVDAARGSVLRIRRPVVGEIDD